MKKESELAHLNFSDLIHYQNGRPNLSKDMGIVEFDPPLKYSGYCQSCEMKGLLADSEYRLDLITHGSDTDDYETLLGKLPEKSNLKVISEPIMFALESPGADYGHGADYDGLTKRPPCRTYYFVPNPIELDCQWPMNKEKLPYLYSPYFAYLMYEFQMKNVYITNIIKCGLTPKNRFSLTPFKGIKSSKALEFKIRENCYKNYLSKEIDIFKPKMIFAFGQNASKCLDFANKDYPNIMTIRLYHPGARMSRALFVQKNADIITTALKENGLMSNAAIRTN